MYDTMQDAMSSGNTLVFGHRGAMAHAPMNTLAAFEIAHKQGADGIELDAQLSSDGRLVVIHDYTVDASTGGSGKVADMTLSALKMLDAGGWFAPDFVGQRIPTLDEVFDAVGDKLLINVEIKSESAQSNGIEEAVFNCIAQHQMQERVIVSSFNPYALRRFREISPTVMIGFLHAPGTPAEFESLMATVSHQARHPWHDLIDADYMRWARDAGLFVNAWTINDVKRAQQLKRLGVNAIITDDPERIITGLQ